MIASDGKMIYRFIPPKWLKDKLFPVEGYYTFEEALAFNEQGYNVFSFPNYPSQASYEAIPVKDNGEKARFLNGTDVDTFEYVFADMDLKEGIWTKDSFIAEVLNFQLLPTRIVDSGNGIHAYWRVVDLDPMTFLRLNRRICRRFKSDEAVSTLNQLMRVANTINTKNPDDYKLAEVIWDESSIEYTSEMLHNALPPIQLEDEEYCKHHYDQTYNSEEIASHINEEIPVKFMQLVKTNKEMSDLFYRTHKDRSKADFRLGHLMLANNFTKEEAIAVLMNTSKASERTKHHRYTYASNIVDKIWLFEKGTEEQKKDVKLSRSVKEILEQSKNAPQKTRFKCHKLIDATDHGFRLSEVMGFVGGSGNGKTTCSMNFFKWFAEENPEYIHVFASLEMPDVEIAERWANMVQGDDYLNDKVHILGNYNEDGTYRNLALKDIQEYIIGLEKTTGKKVGCVIIDHIGVLKQEKSRGGEYDGLVGVCMGLKSFAIATNTFLIIQSQTSRAKNGIGDIELDLDAAFGTSNFEWYCDYVMTMWQPLKRVYDRASNMTVMAYKLAKIRKKNVKKDLIKADKVYSMMFDPDTELLRAPTSDEYKQIDHWSKIASQLRNKDKKKEPTPISVIDWIESEKIKENRKLH